MNKKKMLLVAMPGWTVDYPCHALCYVAGIVKSAGWDCRQADMNIALFKLIGTEGYELWDEARFTHWHSEETAERIFSQYGRELRNILLEHDGTDQYDIVAFTVNMTTRYLTLKASQFIRTVNPDRPILFGGVDCFPGETGQDLFHQEGAPDVICQGESEIALPEFLREFERTGDHRTSAKGFAYKHANNIIDNGNPDTPDFKGSPVFPDWSQVDFSLYRRPGDFPSFFSRGCVNRCTFCSECANYKKYRVRDPVHVVKEIEHGLEHVRSFAPRPRVRFSDSLLNGDPPKLEKFCDLIVKAELKVNWDASVRFSEKMTRSLLAKMAAAGCDSLLWGLESGSQKVLDLMNKNVRLDVATNNIADASELNIQSILPIIVGYPGELAADFVSTVKFCLSFRDVARLDNIEILSILPNSELHHNYREHGIADNRSLEWVSIDRRNDMQVRLTMRFILMNVVQNRSLSTHSMAAKNDLEMVDFNHFPVASAVAAILYELSKCNGNADQMLSLLTRWRGPVAYALPIDRHEMDYWHPNNIPRDFPLDGWFQCDKNSERGRTMVCNLLFEAIRRL